MFLYTSKIFKRLFKKTVNIGFKKFKNTFRKKNIKF